MAKKTVVEKFSECKNDGHTVKGGGK